MIYNTSRHESVHMCGVILAGRHPLIGNSVKLIDLHDYDTAGGVPKNNVEPVLIVSSNVYRQFYEPVFSTYYGVSGISWEFIQGHSRDLIPHLIEYCNHDS